MISTIDGGREFRIEANNAHRRDGYLNAAVEAVLQYATKEGRHGSLVTYLGHATFTVAASGNILGLRSGNRN